MKRSLPYIILLSIFLAANLLFAQNTPSSFINNSVIEKVNIVEVDNPLSSSSKNQDIIELYNYTFAISIVDLHLLKKGKWVKSEKGEWIWILKIKANNAKSLALDFNTTYLSNGDDLFIFNEDKNIHNISRINIKYSRTFSSKFFTGNNISVEFNPKINDTLKNISKSITLNFAFKEVNGSNSFGFGTSGECEINAKCNEKTPFDPEKRSVVRIRTVKSVNGNTYLGWCTGTIIGNTNKDNTPYIITADHCYNYMVNRKYEGASTKDLQNWVFYFNYNSPDCINPSSEGVLATQYLRGASHKANSGNAGDSDSDFCLLKLDDNIPTEYNPFWAGWDNRNISSTSGYSYHHPSGDLKKINTYTKLLASSEYDNRITTDTHWEVFWKTGVTEAGSSGSSILNSKGQVIGILTGGGSSCSSITSSDFYGKLSYSWEYKPEVTSQLKHWLNPSNTNTTSILGYDSMGSKKIEFTNELTVFPNPILNGVINLGNIDPLLLKEVIIYNINGKEVYKAINTNRTSYKIELPNGIYFLKTYYKNKVSVTKLLVIN